MLFRRRAPLSFRTRVRRFVLPPGGWWRALRYFSKRVLRLRGTPHAVAMGFGVGIFIAWSPFFGLHYLMAAGLSYVLRGNILAALFSTTIGNPLTLPALWALAYQVGELMIGIDPATAPPLELPENFAERSFDAIWPVVKLILLGSIPLGLVSGVISYFVVRFAVNAYQQGRRQRLAERRLHAPAPTGRV